MYDSDTGADAGDPPNFQERGYLSRRGCQRLNKVLAECTDLYNCELELWREQYEETGKSDSLFERMKAFTVTRNSNKFWNRFR